MRRNQLGIGLGGLMVGAAIFIVVALIGLKLAPSYIEFFAIKKAVNAIASEAKGGGTVAEVRKSFDLRASVDAIESVKGADLEVTKDSNGLQVSVAYRKEIPLVANIGVYIEFRAASQD
jgi:hypothetical protein